ncbi:MAG: glycine cleavage system aminomethyltransferase GcvT, partial [Sedimentisphaerales bacterium]|nr:glycine cleavage system aminomethyltransferase GcvT [Sedimentisphaerales bacterium]
KRTPLYHNHLKLNARMVAFGGWDMPVQYEGILSEHQQTRSACAVFDICHMGEFIVKGDAVVTGLDRLVSMRIVDMPVSSCRYGFLLNDRGTVLDDLIIFRVAKEEWFLVVNGATTDKDAAHFRKNLKQPSAFKDISPDTGKIDVQGPNAREVMKDFGFDLSSLEYYHFDHFEWKGHSLLISRTGYTGELGYEIYCPWELTEQIWNQLLTDSRVKPAGLGARDVLRLEVGYPLYGHELSEEITPLEAGLKKFVDFEKDFIGKEALLKQQTNGVSRSLVGFMSENRRAPRGEQKIFSEDHRQIGLVVSGTFSPVLQKGIGLAFVEKSAAVVGQKIYFGDDKQKNFAMICPKMFFKEGSLKA